MAEQDPTDERAKNLPEMFKKNPTAIVQLKNMTPSWNVGKRTCSCCRCYIFLVSSPSLSIYLSRSYLEILLTALRRRLAEISGIELKVEGID